MRGSWTIRAAVMVGLAGLSATPALAGSASAARSRVNMAEEYVDGPRRGEVEDMLQAAEKFLDGVPDAERKPIEAKIKAIRERLATMITPEDERKVSAARGKIRQAQRQIDDRQTSGIEDTFKAAEKYLDGVPEKFRAPVIAELEAVKAKYSGGKPADTVKPDTSKPDTVKPNTAKPDAGKTGTGGTGTSGTSGTGGTGGATEAGLNDEQKATLQRATDRMAQVRQMIADGQYNDVGIGLVAVEGYSRQLPPAAKERLVKEIAALKELNAQEADAAENRRRVNEEIGRHLRSAESFRQSSDARMAADSIQRATLRLADPEARKWIEPAQLQKYEADLAAVKTKLAADNKAEVLSRARALVDKLEEKLASDPFKGKDQRAAYEAASSMESLKKGITAWLKDLPADDANAKKLRDRLAAADAKIATADAAWGKAQVDSEVSGGWDVIQKEIAGWEAEQVDPKAGPLEFPRMAKTETAIRRIRYWLEDKRTKEIRAQNKGDAKLEAMYADAERAFEQAAAKLSQAYNKVLDSAERMPTPMRRFELDRPSSLMYEAQTMFAGTKHHASDVERAKKLDERWKAEVAAIMKARQELCDKLSKEAVIKWPGIAAGTGAQDGFVPQDAAAWKGKVVQLKGVYNRAGWDFSGRDYDFVVRINGTPVAGTYEPYITKAIEHALYELKIGVDDHTEWDVIGVVEGMGKVGQRVTVTLRDKDTRLEIGKIEEYRPEDCVRLKIIALRAGPVAAGPGN